MAEFKIDEVNKYGGQGGGGYFSLRNDRDQARVIFPFRGAEDIKGYSVHKVKVNGKDRYVNCLHEYGQPKDDCPLCAKGDFTMVKFFIPVYNVAQQRMQTWERGKKFGDELVSLCAHNPNIVTHGFEIERLGKQGDPKTQYMIHPDRTNDDPNRTPEDFEVTNPVGTIILDKSYEELSQYVATGSFGDDSSYGDRPTRNYEDERPVRRPSYGSNNGGYQNNNGGYQNNGGYGNNNNQDRF